MTVGFDISQTGTAKAGCGFFADGLIRKLVSDHAEDRYILYPAIGDLYWDPDFGRATFHCNRRNCARFKAPGDFDSSRRFWLNPGVDFEADIGNPDVFHTNSYFCPRGLQRARLVYTLYDLSFVEEPCWATETMRVGCFDGLFRASLFADWIVCISDFSRRHFQSIFPTYPVERLSVVHPASRFEAMAKPARPARLECVRPGEFWLSVGTIEPRKNHARLFEAYRMLKEQTGSALPLVLAGGRGWLLEETAPHAGPLEPGKDLIQLGYVSDAELQWLYENCFALVYPSFFEGFGMPVLEALGLGAPVLCSAEGALHEPGGEAAVYFNPRDARSIAEAMAALVRGEFSRDELKRRGLEHAKTFSWSRSAALVSAIYKAVVQLPRRSAGRGPSLA